MITIGIDPGARNTAVSVRDNENSIPLLSSTYVRPDDMEPVTWAVHVTKLIREDVVSEYPDAPIGIEGVTKPNPYNNGKKSLNNPTWLIHLSMVVGALAASFPEAVIVRPHRNGSQPLETYPEVLKGRRPKTLPGVTLNSKTRDHERSAWDVAGEVENHLNNGYLLDHQN